MPAPGPGGPFPGAGGTRAGHGPGGEGPGLGSSPWTLADSACGARAPLESQAEPTPAPPAPSPQRRPVLAPHRL